MIKRCTHFRPNFIILIRHCNPSITIAVCNSRILRRFHHSVFLMAKRSGKKFRNEKQDKSRFTARKHVRKVTYNIPTEVCHPPVQHINSSVASTQKKEELSGYIFMCSGMTKPECYVNRVFGLPAGRREDVEKIKPGTMLFLFDFDVKLLYGVYEADSTGGMNLQPTAFGGRFPAQVKFKICMDCLPLPLSSFRTAIKDNFQGSKFAPELNDQQVKDLLFLFKPIFAPSSVLVHPPPPNAPKLWVRLGAPKPQVQPLAPNAAPGSRMPPPVKNIEVNSLLNPPLPMQYRPYMAQALHNHSQCMNVPQFVHDNGLNPHSHLHHPSAHQAPPAHVNPHKLPENRPPYLSNESPRNLQEPYPSYMTMPQLYPRDQTAGFSGGYNSSAPQPVYPTATLLYGSPHLQTPLPYSGPSYLQQPPSPPRGSLMVDRSMPVSSYRLI